jgi:F-type H+-transporting ATPase subunit gamma
VFGSDQGLVGPFNDAMADFVAARLSKMPGKKIVWAVGERIQSRLGEMNSLNTGHVGSIRPAFNLPGSIEAITPLVTQILVEIQARRERGEIAQVYLFHHRPAVGAGYTPVSHRLLPLDQLWRSQLADIAWPTKMLPEVMNDSAATLLAFVHEYLFVSLFRACAASLASENASRLAAMQRAEKNIDELLDDLRQTFNRLRQSGIDEELFDVVSGFEALTT